MTRPSGTEWIGLHKRTIRIFSLQCECWTAPRSDNNKSNGRMQQPVEAPTHNVFSYKCICRSVLSLGNAEASRGVIIHSRWSHTYTRMRRHRCPSTSRHCHHDLPATFGSEDARRANVTVSYATPVPQGPFIMWHPRWKGSVTLQKVRPVRMSDVWRWIGWGRWEKERTSYEKDRV